MLVLSQIRTPETSYDDYADDDVGAACDVPIQQCDAISGEAGNK